LLGKWGEFDGRCPPIAPRVAVDASYWRSIGAVTAIVTGRAGRRARGSHLDAEKAGERVLEVVVAPDAEVLCARRESGDSHGITPFMGRLRAMNPRFRAADPSRGRKAAPEGLDIYGASTWNSARPVTAMPLILGRLSRRRSDTDRMHRFFSPDKYGWSLSSWERRIVDALFDTVGTGRAPPIRAGPLVRPTRDKIDATVMVAVAATLPLAGVLARVLRPGAEVSRKREGEVVRSSSKGESMAGWPGGERDRGQELAAGGAVSAGAPLERARPVALT